MKKIIVNKTIKTSLIIIFSLFIVLFIYTLICGKSGDPQLGKAPRKCECITFQEAIQETPFIFFFSLLFGIFYFPIGYGYNKKKLEMQTKREEREKRLHDENSG